MANRGLKRQAKGAGHVRHAANDDAHPTSSGEACLPQPVSPANDNPSLIDLPTCLEVTDDEVRLLHRYLGREILALFG
jgi:hypothetical protein